LIFCPLLLRNYWQRIIYLKGKTIYRDLTSRCVKVKKQEKEIYIVSIVDSVLSPQKITDKLNKILEKISQINNQNKPELKRIIWSFFPMFVEYLDNIKSDLTIFDAVDNWIEHPSFSKYKELLKKNYQIITQKSDLIFTVAENLLDFFKEFGREKDIFWIANGVDTAHFKNKGANKPREFRKIKQSIIGYVGIIQQRLDIDLMEYLAQKNQDKSFVLIGPLWPVYFRKFRRSAVEIKRLKKYKNINLLGRKPYKLSSNYINNFDLAISPHKVDNFSKYTNSLKVLEYLACGKPVVSTPLSGVERFSHLIYIAGDYEDFNKKLNQALENNNVELEQKRIEQAEKENWDGKIKEMVEIIENKLSQ
jgi:glycosyltransferase involved in cell wall biosynthesis